MERANHPGDSSPRQSMEAVLHRLELSGLLWENECLTVTLIARGIGNGVDLEVASNAM